MRLWPWGDREVKESRTSKVVWMQTMGRAVWTPRQYDKLAKEAYMQNAIAYACVRKIAEAAATVPMMIFMGEKEVENHPLANVLKRPNPTEGTASFLERLYAFLQLSGNGYVEFVKLGQEVREMYVLRPDRMQVVPGPRGYPVAYKYKIGQNEATYPISPRTLNPIMHIRLFHPLSDHYGMSPVEAAAYSIDVHNEAGAYNKSLLQNQARPSGALMYGKNSDKNRTMSDELWARMKGELEEKYTGAKNAGRPLILEGDFDWKEMNLTMRDMEFMKGKEASAREIALAFGCPPMILGIPGDNTYANYKEANAAFFRQTVLPLVERIAEALTNHCGWLYGEGFTVKYDLDEIPALAYERETVWDKVKAADWLTLNEKREATGYDKVNDPNADKITRAAGQVPIDTPPFTPGGPAPVDPAVDPKAPPKKPDPKKKPPAAEE